MRPHPFEPTAEQAVEFGVSRAVEDRRRSRVEAVLGLRTGEETNRLVELTRVNATPGFSGGRCEPVRAAAICLKRTTTARSDQQQAGRTDEGPPRRH